MYVAWADSFDGPWQARKVDITGMGNLHISNPSIAFLESGKVMLAYRFNRDGEQNGFALANSFLGPFRSTANLTKAPGNDEDPVCTDAGLRVQQDHTHSSCSLSSTMERAWNSRGENDQRSCSDRMAPLNFFTTEQTLLGRHFLVMSCPPQKIWKARIMVVLAMHFR
eukprot:m.202118 g.202118  ORF g.202118 m.202118 type:complete len:167 (-) comp15356_c0_seq3:180-680(-)